jgi:hypothetical protein
MLKKTCSQKHCIDFSIRSSGTLQPVHRLPQNVTSRDNIHQASRPDAVHIMVKDGTARPPSPNERWSDGHREGRLVPTERLVRMSPRGAKASDALVF